MTLDLAGSFADAAAVLRRDKAVLPWIAGVFFFLPQLAVALFVPGVAVAETATDAERLRAVFDALESVVHWLLLAQLVQYLGIATLMALYLDRDRPHIGGAIRTALGTLPRFAIAMFAANLAVLGGLLLIIPGLYLIGRLFLLAPVLVAERANGFAATLPRTFELTRGRGWLLLAMAAMVYFPGQLVVLVAGSLRDPAASSAGMAAEFVTAFGGGIAAAASAAVTLAIALLQITVYRKLVSKQGI